MNEDKIYITEAGYNKLQKIKNLYNESKPLLTQKINRAKSHGDLRENSEYQLAMEEKAILDKKLSELNNIIANCYIIDINKINESKVIYGAIVYFKKNNQENYYILVGDQESDIDNNLLSIFSLLGKSFLGKRVNDSIEFNNDIYTITKIEYNGSLVEKIVNDSGQKELEIIEKSIKESFNY
jgi:transcription elongation factor GreA